MGESIEQLVASAVAGDEAALTALLESHAASIRSALARSYRGRLNGQVDLDDVMQVTYMEVFLRIREFVPTGPRAFGAWLKRIAENNLRDAIRKSDGTERQAPAAVSPPGERSDRAAFDPAAGISTPSRIAGRDESRRLLEAALGQLPPDYERVLRLYDLEGRSGPEVAELIGRSHGAVKMLVARARERLTELLGSGSKYFSDRA